MNNFSINRFWKTLSWYTRVNMQRLLMWTIGTAVVVFFGELLMIRMSNFLHSGEMVVVFSAMGCAAFIVVLLLMVASITSEINKKGKREAFLMLPANNLEKYLTLVVFSSVICVICIFAAMAAGDTLRMGVMWLIGNWWESALPDLIKSLTIDFNSGSTITYTTSFVVMRGLSIITIIAWIHSLFLLGGTLLRKYAFVASGLAMLLSIRLYAWMYWTLDLNTNHVVEEFVEDGVQHAVLSAGQLYYITVLVTTLLAVFNYRAAFRIFKGYQLITNKWTNYDILKR